MTLVRPIVTEHLPSLFELDDVDSSFAPSKYEYDIIYNVYFRHVKISISIKSYKKYISRKLRIY